MEAKVASRTFELEQATKQLKLTKFSIDRSVEIIAWIDPNAEIVYVNDSACEILGYSRDWLLGLNICEVNPAFSPAAWAKHWQQLRSQGSLQLETSLRSSVLCLWHQGIYYQTFRPNYLSKPNFWLSRLVTISTR